MQENLDREDLLFFKKRIDGLEIQSIYTRKLFSILDDAFGSIEQIENDLEKQYFFCLNIWNELSKLCELLFVKRPDDFFNTLRALEYEYTGRTLFIAFRCGWLVQTKQAPIERG